MSATLDVGYKYLYCPGTVQVSLGPGKLHTVNVVRPPIVPGIITLYDGIGATGNLIAEIELNVPVSLSVQPIGFLFDVALETGLYVEFDGVLTNATITVTYV